MKIWFRAGMEADITPEELEVLQEQNGRAHQLMKEIIKRSELSGETYIVGKNNALDMGNYDNPDEDIDFEFEKGD